MVSPCGFESHLSHQESEIPLRVSQFFYERGCLERAAAALAAENSPLDCFQPVEYSLRSETKSNRSDSGMRLSAFPAVRQIVVWRFVSKFPVIARPVRRLVVAIPRLEGKCTEKHPQGWELPRFLVVIVTWFLSTGGLPRQCAHWLAMTAKTYKHQFAGQLGKTDKHIFLCDTF